ncbi:MAG: hypothetical protein KF763_19955 [Cyclobacteriaceae bacterium]|nr:hypothetical protein [Cyclobacteriaceae bacterium]
MQLSLDIVGLVPGAGEIADGVNGLIYLARGDIVNASLSGAAMLPFLGSGATGTKLGTKVFTKSSLQLGQEMHKAYKVGADGIKEFRLPSGKRIDFLDVNNGIIYELKPFNPRAMKAGEKQLGMYLNEIQSPATLLMHPQLRGINWKTVLDTY